MLTIHLHDLLFHGYHGLYSGEETVGNAFEVNLDILYDPPKDKLNNIENLINYEDIFRIVQQKMSAPTPLLEELANGIVQKVKNEFNQVESISITIYKLRAPLETFQGKVGITLHRKFDS